jgi:peptidoglycan/xylan/chitin deacetylase (PgdA/CDA1 family)
LTNDVETTSLVNHCLSDKTGKLVAEAAIPKVLDLYAKHQIKTTFFITGYFAEKFPEAVKQIFDKGHEIGCHGYSHKHTDGFDILNFEQQKEHLAKAKKILEDIIGDEVISFRSPALRTNEFTVRALEETGFKIDSSISSQRFDFFFSLGSKEKLAWLKAPRKPYFSSNDSLSKKGDSNIFEIPISAFVIPYIGTIMRISPTITRILRNYLCKESINKGNPINFLIHPIELIEEERNNQTIQRRSANPISYLLKDKIRHSLKTKNLGENGLKLLEEQIRYFKDKGFEFITCKDCYLQYNNIT